MKNQNIREYIFRGKRVDNGEWVQGDLRHGGYYDGDKTVYITVNDYCVHNYPVTPETIGQFTGVTDKNGKKIFEGDIVSFTRVNALGYTTKRLGDVRYYDELPIFYIMATTGDAWDWCVCEDIEVIGNIHDNPELITE